MKRHTLIRLVAILGVFALIAAGCGGTRDDGGDTAGGDNKELTSAPGFDVAAKTIRVGVITPLTGPVAVIGNPLTAGTETWFRYINEARGGIGGYKVEVVKEDSQYRPDLGVQGYNKIKNNVAVIAQLLGTPVTKAVLPLLKTDNVVAAPASLDAEWVLERNLLPVGGPYQIQMINAASYLVKEQNKKNAVFCSLIQDDAYGQAGQQGIDFAAKELDFKVAVTAKYAPGTTQDFTAQVQQLRAGRCEIVFLVATPTDTSKVMATSSQLGFAPQWVGQSPTWTGGFVRSPLAPYFQKNFLLAAEGTEWGDRSVKGMADMLDRVNSYTPNQAPDIYFVFGYYQARAVTALLEKAIERKDMSREGILAALENLGTVTFDGLTDDYEYGAIGKRNPPRATTIFSVDPAKPGGLAKVKYQYKSDEADKYEFKAG